MHENCVLVWSFHSCSSFLDSNISNLQGRTWKASPLGTVCNVSYVAIHVWCDWLMITVHSGWAHVVCALYIPEVTFGNNRRMEPIVTTKVPKERFSKVLYVYCCPLSGFPPRGGPAWSCVLCINNAIKLNTQLGHAVGAKVMVGSKRLYSAEGISLVKRNSPQFCNLQSAHLRDCWELYLNWQGSFCMTENSMKT